MSTLAYFPEIHPEELFYSVLARYHQHMGAQSPIQSMETLFGRRLVVVSVDLPGYLQALADRLPEGFGWTAQRLIDELTLLPYYTAFQPTSVRRWARTAMLQGKTDGLLMRLGMAAFRVGRVTRLRFCALCLQQMHADHGECYWRRDHQLPSVRVCPDHGCSLQASTVSVTAQSRHIPVASDLRSCPWDAPMLVHERDRGLLADLQRLAQASRILLKCPRPGKSKSEWTQHYQQGIYRAGLAYSPKRFDQQRLQEQFREYHRKTLTQWPSLMTGADFRGGWLPAMVRTHRKMFHPLQHILLQDFIDHQPACAAPFGNGPWPCLNPLAQHKGKAIIAAVSMHRNHGHRVGVFECQCGYVYTRSLLSGGDGVGPPRFQSYGPMLLPTLKQMISRGMSLRRIACVLELDPKSVVKLATDLGISIVWKVGMGRKSSASSAPASDRTLPSPTEKHERQRSCKPCLDWNQVDLAACDDIRGAVQQLLLMQPPQRITVACVERTIRNRGWLSKRADKLPLAMAYLSSVVESVEKFQRRRVEWVIQQMDKAGEPLRVWQVLRKSGLTSIHEKVVVSMLHTYMDRCGRGAE